MRRFTLGEPTLTRAFALLSLVTITFITTVQVTVQWVLFRGDLLERERTTSANMIRAEAYSALRPEDFQSWQEPEAQERFRRFFRRALLNLEVLRVKVFDAETRIVWSDEARLLGTRFPDNDSLLRALRGETVAHLQEAKREENVFEKGFPRTIEVYIPLAFSSDRVPGTAKIAGVVEVYKDPTRVVASIARGRWMIISTSVAGALVLYAALFGIVRRASRQLQVQRDDLKRQASTLSMTNLELRATRGRLQAAERLATLGEVSAAVAHGIRNPLANIRASAQVALVSQDRPESVEKSLNAITSEVDRLSRWLRALLDVVGPLEPHPVPVDLNALMDDLLPLFSDRVAERSIRLERHFASHLPTVMADEVLLQQVFLGVLENAIDALPRGGALLVGTERVENNGGRPEGRVTVQDSGEGIPADRLSKIFEPFFTTKRRGTGLGLAIARKVVEAHGGRIEIQSEVGAGTTVRISLPVEGPSQEKT